MRASYRDLAPLFRNVLTCSAEDRYEAMGILADYLEEFGDLDTANTYRYASLEKLYPFPRSSGSGKFTRKNHERYGEYQVYDWNSMSDYLNVPLSSRVDWSIIEAIKQDQNRRYGGVSLAFRLLKNALKKQGRL